MDYDVIAIDEGFKPNIYFIYIFLNSHFFEDVAEYAELFAN